MSARSIARGIWLRSDQGIAEAEISGQLASASGASISSQPSWVEPFAPEWPSWQQMRASVSRCTKSTMRFQAASCSGAYMPVQPGDDAPLRADAGHLDIDEAGAALGALGIVDEVPVGRAAVDGLVLIHRRDDDAVLEFQVAQAERREHRPAHDIRRRPARRWNQVSALSSQLLSRSRRFSWLMRCERVSSE